ncbi:MAG TPA: type IV pilus biogenesis/stability protein PilW [Steroidobacteraceae bacterium]|jgi:type IV pilus assembly protein PilF|nr:type IV pilus biogenesis/stability protein PilW [Steroidobacteraceae bacterium]
MRQHSTGRAPRHAARGGLAQLAGLAAAGVACAALAACTTTTTTTTSFAPSSNGQAKGNNTDAASINVQLGLDYLQKNELGLAQTKLQRALKEDPHSANAHGAMGLLDERLGDAKGADREYRRALVLSEHAPLWLNDYAVYLCSHGRQTEGVHYFEEAAANPLYPTPWEAYTNAGVCLRGEHRNADAMARFTRALQVNPDFAEGAFEAASLQYAEQNQVEARQRIDTFLAHNPPTPALLLLGWQIARAQNDAVGQQRYALLLARDFPTSPQAHALEPASRGGSD